MLKNPISVSVASGNLDNFQNLIRNEKNIKVVVERDGLLHVACKYGHINIVKELLKCGADCGGKHPGNQRIPLHEACTIGDVDLVELMAALSKQFIDSVDRNGYTPAHICAMEGERNCLKILRDHDANFSVKDKNGMNLIHWAAKRNHSSIIYYLFELGEDMNIKCASGRTALHYAAMNNSIDALQSLIKCRADITLRDNEDASCLHLAAKHGTIECLRLLVSLDVPIDIRNINGKTPAHLASLQGFNECLHWLLDNGADISAVDDNGNTIGHCACQKGDGKTINCYLNHNGCTDLKNKLNEDLYQTARRYGHPLKFEMAKKSEIVCSICQIEMNKRKWNQIHASPAVIKTINKSEKTLYKNPLGSFSKIVVDNKKTFDQKKSEKDKKYLETINIGKSSPQKLQKKVSDFLNKDGGYRDLITRYYGDFIHDK